MSQSFAPHFEPRHSASWLLHIAAQKPSHAVSNESSGQSVGGSPLPASPPEPPEPAEPPPLRHMPSTACAPLLQRPCRVVAQPTSPRVHLPALVQPSAHSGSAHSPIKPRSEATMVFMPSLPTWCCSLEAKLTLPAEHARLAAGERVIGLVFT